MESPVGTQPDALQQIHLRLTRRKNDGRQLSDVISDLSSNDEIRQVLTQFLHPSSDLHQVKQIWSILTQKLGNPVIFEFLKQWKNAPETATSTSGMRGTQEWLHLILVFVKLFDKSTFDVFPDTKKLKDFLAIFANLLEQIASSSDTRAHRVATKRVQSLVKKVPALFDILMDMVQSNFSNKTVPLLFPLLKYATEPKNTTIYEKYENSLLELYEKQVLSVKGKVNSAVRTSFVPLLQAVSQDAFINKILPTVVRQIKRSPDCLETIAHLLQNTPRIDLNEHIPQLASFVKDYTQSSSDDVRKYAIQIVETLARRSTKEEVVQALFDTYIALVAAGGSNWYSRHGAVSALYAVVNSGVLNAMSAEFRSKLVAKAISQLVPVTEKETNVECLQIDLLCLSSWTQLDASQITSAMVNLFIKGMNDKEKARLYLTQLCAALRNSLQPDGQKIPLAQAEMLVKPLSQIVLTVKSKVALATEGMLALAILAILAANYAKIDEQVAEEKVWAFVLTANSFALAPSFISKLDETTLPAQISLIGVLITHHFTKIDQTSTAKLVYNAAIQLLQHEKPAIRKLITDTIQRAHTYCPQLSANLVDTFENETIPSLLATGVPPYFDRPMHERKILSELVCAIVAPNLPHMKYLPRLALITHHPLLATSKKTNIWNHVLKKLGLTEENVFSDSSLLDAIVEILTDNLKSPLKEQRNAAVLATAMLLRNNSAASALLHNLVLLFDVLPRDVNGASFQQCIADNQNTLSALLSVMRIGANKNSRAFEDREASFLFSTIDKVAKLAGVKNELQTQALDTLETLGLRCISQNYKVHLLTCALRLSVRIPCDSHDALVEAINHLADSTHAVDPRSWALLQLIVSSQLNKQAPSEVQEKALSLLAKNIKYASGVMVLALVGAIQHIPLLAEQAHKTLVDIGKVLTVSRPMHKLAIAPLLRSCHANPHRGVRLAALEALAATKDLASFQMHNIACPALWVASFDESEENAELGQELYKSYCERTNTSITEDYYAQLQPLLNIDGFFPPADPLPHPHGDVCAAAARAIVGAMKLYPHTQRPVLDALFKLYESHCLPFPIRAEKQANENPENIRIRHGVAEVLKALARLDNIYGEDLEAVIRFIMSKAVGDHSPKLYDKFLDAGIRILSALGGQYIDKLHTLLEKYIDAPAATELLQSRTRQTAVILLGTLAQHVSPEDPRIKAIVSTLLEVLHTPSEAVQKAIANNLAVIIQRIPSEAEQLLRPCLELCLTGADYGDRRGGAYGLAGLVKGLKPIALSKYPFIMAELEKAANDKSSEKARQGALLAYECFSIMLKRLFEPWVIKILPQLLTLYGDNSPDVRESTNDTAKAIMSNLTGIGVTLVLPVLLKTLEGLSAKWRTKTGAIEMLGAMAYCQPEQLGHALPTIFPKLTTHLADAHAQVQQAARAALNSICKTIQNPEIRNIAPTLLKAVDDINKYGPTALNTLSTTKFVNRIDAPSLSLIMPVLDRALRDRSTEIKTTATRIVGSMCALTEPSALKPYIKVLIEQLKAVLVDPIPATRSTAAVALGLLVKGMENAADVLPWLLETMKSDAGSVERQGAAQGLAQLIGLAMDLEAFKAQLLPRIIHQCSAPHPNTRQGYLSLFIYLPDALGTRLEFVLDVILPAVIAGLADEAEQVRDAAFKAGKAIVQRFGDDEQVDVLLPTLLTSMFDSNWRIRNSSVLLLGELLYKISGAAEDFANKDISVMVETRTRTKVMAALYVLREDLNEVVRQSAINTWKMLVVNPPKTLRAIMPELMDTIIELLSGDEEKQEVAGKTLGEVVSKLGERVLPEVLPVLERELNSLLPSTRVGVCHGFTEVLSSAKHIIMSYFDQIAPVVQRALCDESVLVREAAAITFDHLYKVAGDKAVDALLPSLLTQMESKDPQESEKALHGLQQMLTVKSNLILPSLIPKLTVTPITPFNARALASIAEVSGASFNNYISTIVPILVRQLYGHDSKLDEETREEIFQATKRIILVMKGSGLNLLFTQLYKLLGDNSPHLRVGAASLIGVYCAESKTLFTEHIATLLQNLLRAYNDPYQKTIEAAQVALSAVTAAIPKDDTSKSYISVINDALETAGVVDYLPGFNQPNGLQPLLPLYRDALLTGTQEERELAAIGMKYMLNMTDPAMLKPYLQQIIGPLIRILMERSLSTPVRIAMLSTLNLVIQKGSLALRAFAAQLQPTYVKYLLAPSKGVRDLAAEGVCLLLQLGAKPDFLLKDLIRTLKDPSNPAPESCLLAIKNTLKALAKSSTQVQDATIAALREAITPFTESSDENLRTIAGAALVRTYPNAPEESDEE